MIVVAILGDILERKWGDSCVSVWQLKVQQHSTTYSWIVVGLTRPIGELRDALWQIHLDRQLSNGSRLAQNLSELFCLQREINQQRNRSADFGFSVGST